MKAPTIVAPAGDITKLKAAVAYGAHEVYFGGEAFNLRTSKNFSFESLEEAVQYCAQRGVKSVFLMNAFLHEGAIGAARDFLATLRSIPFDAIMVSDPGMLALVREGGFQGAIHLSTQMSTLNHLSAKLWQSLGVARLVLAREVTIDEIRRIHDNTDIELETFVHGALCISYSGRCLLSRYLSGRDANNGACSHPCRWHYSLVEEKRPGFHLDIVEHAAGTEILASKDLCMIKKIGALLSAGITAFKIEGRMKSPYYVANITRLYRHALDLASAGRPNGEFLDFYDRELSLVSHRPYTDDLFNEFGEMENRELPYIKNCEFIGIFTQNLSECEAEVKMYNPARAGESFEIIYPPVEKSKDHAARIVSIISRDVPDTIARPGETSRITFDRPVYADGIMRKVL